VVFEVSLLEGKGVVTEMEEKWEFGSFASPDALAWSHDLLL
jgi:hypothetical protein